MRLKHVAVVTYGLGQPPRELDGGVPVLRATNIHRGAIVSEGLMRADPDDVPWDRCPPLRRGEILVVRSGAYTGDSALVTPPARGLTLLPSVGRAKPHPNLPAGSRWDGTPHRRVFRGSSQHDSHFRCERAFRRESTKSPTCSRYASRSA